MSVLYGVISISEFKYFTTSLKLFTPIISISLTIEASFVFSIGTITLLILSFLASIHIGKIPFTLFIVPSNDNSPIKIVSSKEVCLICSLQIKIPIAIGKSNEEPSFFISAGARFITIRLLKNSYPEFFIEVLTRSFDSLTLISGKPTISQQGIPLETST